MGLFTPAWKSKNSIKRSEAVEKLKNQKHLTYVALHDESYDIRQKALDKIVNMGMLYKIAKESQFHNVRHAAWKKLGDTDGLIEDMLKDHLYQCEAIALISDKDRLEKITFDNTYELKTRLEAFKKLYPESHAIADDISCILCGGSWPEDEYKRYSPGTMTVSDARKNRAEATERLIRMTAVSADLLAPFWTELKIEIELPYESYVTGDFRYPDDLTGFNYSIHGVGMAFPDNPHNTEQ